MNFGLRNLGFLNRDHTRSLIDKKDLYMVKDYVNDS